MMFHAHSIWSSCTLLKKLENLQLLENLNDAYIILMPMFATQLVNSLRSKRFCAFQERRTGFLAFCPHENWGESKKARRGVGEGKEGNACNQTPRF